MAITAEDVSDHHLRGGADRPRVCWIPTATLESLNIASLDMISVMFALEDKFAVVIEQDDVKEAKTLQDFIDVVLAKAQSTAG